MSTYPGSIIHDFRCGCDRIEHEQGQHSCIVITNFRKMFSNLIFFSFSSPKAPPGGEHLQPLSSPASPRLLYHKDGWGHSSAGYITDYILGAECFLISTVAKFFIVVPHRGNWLAIFSLFMGLAFTFGGIAHHLLDAHPEEPHEDMWNANNGFWWRFVWFVGVERPC